MNDKIRELVTERSSLEKERRKIQGDLFNNETKIISILSENKNYDLLKVNFSRLNYLITH